MDSGEIEIEAFCRDSNNFELALAISKWAEAERRRLLRSFWERVREHLRSRLQGHLSGWKVELSPEVVKIAHKYSRLAIIPATAEYEYRASDSGDWRPAYFAIVAENLSSRNCYFGIRRGDKAKWGSQLDSTIVSDMRANAFTDKFDSWCGLKQFDRAGVPNLSPDSIEGAVSLHRAYYDSTGDVIRHVGDLMFDLFERNRGRLDGLNSP